MGLQAWKCAASLCFAKFIKSSSWKFCTETAKCKQNPIKWQRERENWNVIKKWSEERKWASNRLESGHGNVYTVWVYVSRCVWYDTTTETRQLPHQHKKLLRVTRANSVAIGSNELSSFSSSTSWYHQHRHHCRRRCSRRPRRCHLYRPNCMQRITPANLRWWRRRQCTCWVHSQSPLPVHE